jgi:hypothetical protein
MVPGAGHEVGGSPRDAGIPSRRRRQHGRPGVEVKVVQRTRCSTLTPTPGLPRDNSADATGYPLPPRLSCGTPAQHARPARRQLGQSDLRCAVGVNRRAEREAKIRPCPGRQTSSLVRTQRDTTRTNQQVTADRPLHRRRPAFQVTKVRHHVAASRTMRVNSAQVPPRTPRRGIPATSDVSVFKCAQPRAPARGRAVLRL